MPKQIGNLILYSIDDLHEKLGVSKLTLRSYLRTGRIRGRKLGVSWYVTEESLQEYFSAPERRPGWWRGPTNQIPTITGTLYKV